MILNTESNTDSSWHAGWKKIMKFSGMQGLRKSAELLDHVPRKTIHELKKECRHTVQW